MGERERDSVRGRRCPLSGPPLCCLFFLCRPQAARTGSAACQQQRDGGLGGSNRLCGPLGDLGGQARPWWERIGAALTAYRNLWLLSVFRARSVSFLHPSPPSTPARAQPLPARALSTPGGHTPRLPPFRAGTVAGFHVSLAPGLNLSFPFLPLSGSNPTPAAATGAALCREKEVGAIGARHPDGEP